MCCGLVTAKPVRTTRAHVGAAVAVRVLEVEEVGRGRDEDALLPAHHARRQRQAVGEDPARLEAAVAVRVLEQLDAPGRPRVERIAGHLDDEEASVLVEVHRHRALDVRFAATSSIR